ncbi:MAG: hypothetical protein QMC67_01185 [Candidatus Wallbacteria bacterium]
MTHEDFFNGIIKQLTSNTVDLVIFWTIIILCLSGIVYVYYIMPKYKEVSFNSKMNNFILNRYNLEDYEEEAINQVIRKNSINPPYMFYISQSTFEKYEGELLSRLKETCPTGVSARDTLTSLKERLYS